MRTLLLHAVLHQYQVTSCDISSAFLNTPIEEDIYVQPPPATSTSSTLEATPCSIARITYITKNVAGTSTFYTSRTTTTTVEVRQARLDEAKPHGFGLHRRLIKRNIIVSGATSTISLKHSTVLTTQQPLRLLGKAKDHTRHLAAPSEWDWSHLKHTLWYIKGTLHYKFIISPRLPQGHSLPL